MARALKPLTPEILQDEVRFLIKTLLRDDLFGDEVGVTEAEKLLESSLSIGFVDYCAFLKRTAYIDIDRARNTITVLPRGRNFAEGNPDSSLAPGLASHFAGRLAGAPSPSPSPSPSRSPEGQLPRCSETPRTSASTPVRQPCPAAATGRSWAAGRVRPLLLVPHHSAPSPSPTCDRYAAGVGGGGCAPGSVRLRAACLRDSAPPKS